MTVWQMKIISWNVNGLRAIIRKGFLDKVKQWRAEVVSLQETKTNCDLPLGLSEYNEHWGHGERAGYSGTLVLAKKELGLKRRELPEGLGAEGRGVWLEGKSFHLLNIYFPNGGQGEARLAYKMKYYQEFLELVGRLGREKPVLFSGDVNTAHQEIDLARPRENSKHTGFLPEERAWLDRVVEANFVDVWRFFHPREVGYSWWDYKTRSRERNVGWRIDYFWASRELMGKIGGCEILGEVGGSDHAPLELRLEIGF
jgi:exodeoxyribonuclease-3